MALRHLADRCVGLAGACCALACTGACDEQADQRVEQLRLVQRLGEVGGEEPFGVARFAPAQRAEQHQRQSRRRRRAMRARQLQAVHLGHVHVEDRQVEALAAVSQRSASRGRLGVARTCMPHLAHLQRQHLAVGGVVVDHEHALAGQCGLLADEVAPRARRLRRPSAP